MGKPTPGAKVALEMLKSAGYQVIIHSCNRPQIIADFMKYYGLYYTSIWQGQGKPIADFYVDDKGVPFNGDWNETLSWIL